MPKTGLSRTEWRRRFLLYANGQYKFSRGERPARGTPQDKELSTIEGCPKHLNTSARNVFGGTVIPQGNH